MLNMLPSLEERIQNLRDLYFCSKQESADALKNGLAELLRDEINNEIEQCINHRVNEICERIVEVEWEKEEREFYERQLEDARREEEKKFILSVLAEYMPKSNTVLNLTQQMQGCSAGLQRVYEEVVELKKLFDGQEGATVKQIISLLGQVKEIDKGLSKRIDEHLSDRINNFNSRLEEKMRLFIEAQDEVWALSKRFDELENVVAYLEKADRKQEPDDEMEAKQEQRKAKTYTKEELVSLLNRSPDIYMRAELKDGEIKFIDETR